MKYVINWISGANLPFNWWNISTEWVLRRKGNDHILRDKNVLIYDVYEIAPYAAGEQDLLLYFGQLEELFKPEFRQGNDI